MNIFAVYLNDEIDISLISHLCSRSVLPLNQFPFRVLFRGYHSREYHMLPNWQPECVIRVLEREPEYVCIMSQFDCLPEAQLYVPLGVLPRIL